MNKEKKYLVVIQLLFSLETLILILYMGKLEL